MRLIDADLLEKEIYKWMPKDQETWMSSDIPPIENLVVSIMMTIQEQPTVDAMPVVHGKWIDGFPTVNRWIPVSERLPEMYERVLISVKEDGYNERIELAFLAQLAPWKIRFRAIPHWYEIDDVLAWQPLPKPYEAKNNEKIVKEKEI